MRLFFAALLPFVASVAVVSAARSYFAWPDRVVLDLLHGVFVISYLTSAVRHFQGRADGLARVGLAIPHPRWPGAGAAFQILGFAVFGGGLLFAFIALPLDALKDQGPLFAVMAHIIPEFVINTWLGWVIARYTQGREGTHMVDVKICGINSEDAVSAAVVGGADMLGFVFYPPSPRSITPVEAKALMAKVPDGVLKVILVVDPDDLDVGSICRQLPVDMVQLHGNETPERVAEIKALTGLPVMKAVAIETADDVARAHEYAKVADRLLLDAKPPKDAKLPGGNAVSFDWTLISGETWAVPWMLAGGLTPENVAEAVQTSGAEAVDVSSGVESAPGKKDPARIRKFLKIAKAL